MYSATCRRLAGEIIPVLVFSCAVLATLVVVRQAVLPQRTALCALSDENSRYKALVSDKNRYQAIKALLLDKKEKLEGRLRPVAPPPQGRSADLSGLLQLLILRAKDADIRFVKMQPLDEAQRRMRGEYPVVLEMTTSYQSLGRFVSSLEELPRLLTVERLAITAQKGMIDVKILVTCYLEKAD
jgi:Tfp pilus assembly protein PilO